MMVLAAIGLALLSSPVCSVGKTIDASAQNVVAVAANNAPNAQKEFKFALAAFNSGKFGDAAARFEKLQMSGFAPDAVHYYLALSYQNCNQFGLARAHYLWVAAHSKNALLLKYSRSGSGTLAYHNCHRTLEAQGDSQNATGSTDTTSTSASTSTGNSTSNVRTGPDGNPILQWGYDGLPG